MRRRTVLTLMLLGVIQLFLLLYWRSVSNEDRFRIECGDGRLAFYYTSSNRRYADDANIRINGYRDEDSGEYYLFFPKAFCNKKSRLELLGADVLFVNGESYETESRVGFLGEGRYSLAANGDFYVLNVMYGSDIPSVFIDLDMDSLVYIQESKENTDSGHINMYDAEGNIQYRDGLADIHGRGNSSWDYQRQKGYAITLASDGGLVEEVVSDKWNLIGNGYDESLIENQIMYDLAEEVGLAYSPRLRHIDLYIEGEYVGVYLLTTKVRIARDSVDIDNLEKETELLNDLPLYEFEAYGDVDARPGSSKGFRIPVNPVDITGGYLIEQDHSDRYAQEASGFCNKQGDGFVIKSPQYASREQVGYIQAYLQELTDAITAGDGRNPDTGRSYGQYIDVDSFVKNYIIQEIPKNMDMNLTSQFFYKPRGENSLLYAGPVWDFDYTFGMADNIVYDTALDDPEGLLGEYSYDAENPGFSFADLYRHRDFRDSVARIYRGEFGERLEDLLDSGIDAYAREISRSAEMNRARWGMEEEHRAAVEGIKAFLKKRVDYLNGVW